MKTSRIQCIKNRIRQRQERDDWQEQIILARKGNFILLRDWDEDEREKPFVVYQSSPDDWSRGTANYGERFEGIGQAVLNLIERVNRGY
jgi:hypothetical protein